MATNSKSRVQARQSYAAKKQKPRRSSPVRAGAHAVLRRKTVTPTPLRADPKSDAEPETVVTNFTFYVNPTLTLMCRPAEVPAFFTLGSAADLTGVHPEMLRYYCRRGLLGLNRTGLDREPTFDDESLDEVRRIEHYRRHLAVSRRALMLICELRREAERQDIELHFLTPGAWRVATP